MTADLPSAESILSHSSKIKCLIFFSERAFDLISARSLPGVPTTIWGQFLLRTSSSFLILMPPKKTAILMLLLYLLKRSYSLLIWKANSLVWASTNVETWKKIKLDNYLQEIGLLISFMTQRINKIIWNI